MVIIQFHLTQAYTSAWSSDICDGHTQENFDARSKLESNAYFKLCLRRILSSLTPELNQRIAYCNWVRTIILKGTLALDTD